MLKKIILCSVLLVTACGIRLVKEDKYISTQPFKDDAYRLCLGDKKSTRQPQADKQATCQKEADAFIIRAEHKFREFKADEHNYRLCRSRFSNIQLSDKCFREQQQKYYKRELAGYKASLDQ